MKCILQTYTKDSEIDINELKKEVKSQLSISELDLVERVATLQPVRINPEGKYRVVVIDCGVKQSIINHLVKKDVNVIIVPYNTSAATILSYQPHAVLVSNGPGDPLRMKQTIAIVRQLIGKTVLYGICLGHQIIALALGATTYKLKFGHRGLNQPVKCLETGRVFISTQNHGFCVDSTLLEHTGLEITHINPNDNTIEGLAHHELPIRLVQFHPEASPGPHDTYFFFDNLIKDIRENAKEN
jgi:carbamoyl-phosphate synthase small subunit